MWKFYYLMPPSFWQYHRNIEINVTYNCHFAFVYLLGKLDYSLTGQRNENRLYIISLCWTNLSSREFFFPFLRLCSKFTLQSKWRKMEAKLSTGMFSLISKEIFERVRKVCAISIQKCFYPLLYKATCWTSFHVAGWTNFL